MIIGFDGSRTFSKERTGTENYSYQLLLALNDIDHKNEYIIYVRHLSLVTCHLSPNFQFKEISWPRLWTQGGLAKRTFQDSLDVLFIPAHTSPLIHKPGLKTLVTVHDLGAEYLPKMHQLKQRLYLKWITHYQLKNATKLIAVSKATKEDLIKKAGIDGKKVEVVYEGYDKNKFKVQSSKFKVNSLVDSLSKFDLVPGKYFLFVGTVQPRKNLARLIEAFAQLVARSVAKNRSALNIVIVGSKGWLSDNIYKLPKKLGIEDRVKFLGHVPDNDLSALYSGAIALSFPSLFEGFGFPILEAQACGCPVLTSNTSSMPEVAGNGALYVDPYSLDSISDGMIRIMNSKLRSELKKKGKENIKRFSWEKCARETLSVFEEV